MLNRISSKMVVGGFMARDFLGNKRAKGVNFLEYALLAMLVVGMFAVLYVVFRDRIVEITNKVFDKSSTSLGNADVATNNAIPGTTTR